MQVVCVDVVIDIDQCCNQLFFGFLVAFMLRLYNWEPHQKKTILSPKIYRLGIWAKKEYVFLGIWAKRIPI